MGGALGVCVDVLQQRQLARLWAVMPDARGALRRDSAANDLSGPVLDIGRGRGAAGSTLAGPIPICRRRSRTPCLLCVRRSRIQLGASWLISSLCFSASMGPLQGLRGSSLGLSRLLDELLGGLRGVGGHSRRDHRASEVLVTTENRCTPRVSIGTRPMGGGDSYEHSC